MLRSLLSYSTKHFRPEEKGPLYGHTIYREAKIIYEILSEMGEVTYIDSTDVSHQGEKYDLMVSLPRNFGFLTSQNEIAKTICSVNTPEPSYLYSVMVADAAKIGCRLSDCFRPANYRHADKFLMLGNGFNKQTYSAAGYDTNKITDLRYGIEDFTFVPRQKNKKTIFLHVATTLGLRKGFWHVVNDFKKADLDAELWCVGEVQRKDEFWHNFAREVQRDARIRIFGWIDCFEAKYQQIMQMADFVVFPSWGEGQPGTVMEAVACGAIPIVSEEAGFPYWPIGKYVRGDESIWHKAHNLSSEEFRGLQDQTQKFLKDEKYTYGEYERIFRKAIEELI